MLGPTHSVRDEEPPLDGCLCSEAWVASPSRFPKVHPALGPGGTSPLSSVLPLNHRIVVAGLLAMAVQLTSISSPSTAVSFWMSMTRLRGGTAKQTGVRLHTESTPHASFHSSETSTTALKSEASHS